MVISSLKKNEEEKTDTDAKPQEEAEKDEAREFIKEEMTTKAASTEPGPEGDTSAKRELKVDPRNKELAVDKDLLQVFSISPFISLASDLSLFECAIQIFFLPSLMQVFFLIGF